MTTHDSWTWCGACYWLEFQLFTRNCFSFRTAEQKIHYGKPCVRPWDWPGQPSPRLHLLLHALQGRAITRNDAFRQGQLKKQLRLKDESHLCHDLWTYCWFLLRCNAAQHFGPKLVWCRWEKPDEIEGAPERAGGLCLRELHLSTCGLANLFWDTQKQHTHGLNTFLSVSCSKMYIQSGTSRGSHAQPSFTISSKGSERFTSMTPRETG